ncbi:hypothetical protein DFP72DRAFT_823084 [Ephemerocybe angulata]|uniref:Uncharacterized protein n=1 Tax=Ephemerocybe angulata TaxID=980116 RepID=A0A8H6HGB3_9AGAR|nr:hypothetical protein DFP72DRAFT_823084 [Tulosesus angulatus]
MRQIDDSPDEVAFRRALNNLRWRNCDSQDIALLRTRLAGSAPDLSVDGDGFKNVSIITALNKDKDQYNHANSVRFAAEVGEKLEDFYSFDKLSSTEPKRTDPKKARRIYSTAKSISKSAQVGLWNQPPNTSEQIPGKLSLCIGMPVIIRFNEATELCITRGQEARVVGWSALKYPKWPGRKYLDVLYVELINPPHMVKLPHLPKNVVPLTRNSESIEAQLPNDQYMRISRSQIPVLPNFSMTDYSSQGKTREWNVVDLTECRSFQGVYTCLSRGTSLARTLIVRDFKDDLLQGELDGSLRQEYRELGYLTTITDLRYRGILPSEIMRPTRWETIRLYRHWKKTAGVNIADAPAFQEEDTVAPPDEEISYEIETLTANGKRKLRELNEKAATKKRRRLTDYDPILANATWASPAGPIWDSSDWSCAFDSLTFIFHWLWVSNRVKWSRTLTSYSPSLASMIAAFEGMPQRDPELEITGVRDEWRAALRETHPSMYPPGRRGTDLMGLIQHVLGFRFASARIRTSCEGCRVTTVETAKGGARTVAAFCSVREALSTQSFVDEAFSPVRRCSSCDSDVLVKHRKSEVLALEVAGADQDLLMNSRIEVGDWGLYRLAGVIYYGDEHFISRVISRNNKVYVHDGIEGGYSTYEGTLDDDFSAAALSKARGKSASVAMYALADRLPAEAPAETDSD